MSSCLGLFVQNNLIKYAKISKENDNIKVENYGIKFYEQNIEKTVKQIVDETFSPTSKNILVIDDIGVVTYQLKILFNNLGYNVQIAKDIFGGLNSFVKTNYSYVIMDLFVSTEQEGYTLLNETKKIITALKRDKALRFLGICFIFFCG